MKYTFIPNFITLVRIAMVPVFILVLLEERYLAAMILFLIAGITDGLDGYVAKRYHLVTRLGAILDPVADKLLLISAYILLTILGHVPMWLLLSIVFRDLLLVNGFIIHTAIFGPLQMKLSLLSKVNTVFQIILIVSILTEQAGADILVAVTNVLILAVMVTTVGSCLHYIWIWSVQGVERDRNV